MNDERKKQLIKYAKPSGAWPVVCVFLAVICFILSLFMWTGNDYIDDDTLAAIVAFAVGGIVFILLFVYYRYVVSKLKKAIDNIEARGELLLLLDDFESGGRAFNDYLRIGRKYLIGKKKCTIVSYYDIVRIYQYIHTTNGSEDLRSLKVKTIDNKTIELCALPLRGKADDEVAYFFAYVRNMNNNIALGYRD